MKININSQRHTERYTQTDRQQPSLTPPSFAGLCAWFLALESTSGAEASAAATAKAAAAASAATAGGLNMKMTVLCVGGWVCDWARVACLSVGKVHMICSCSDAHSSCDCAHSDGHSVRLALWSSTTSSCQKDSDVLRFVRRQVPGADV